MLTHHDFEPHVGKAFHFAGQPIALRLDRLERHRRIAGIERQPFSLTFHGPAGQVMPEGPYQAQPDGGEAHEIYIIPIHTPARDRQDYQAVFT